MSSSKIILVGAIAVVFGLYSLSLIKVQAYLGSTAEDAVYIAKATDNAKSGAQRAINLWIRGNETNWPNSFVYTEPFQLIDGSFSYSITTNPSSFSYNDGQLIYMTIVSTGIYKAPAEPASFQGHRVLRTVSAKFTNTNYGTWYTPRYDIKYLGGYTTVDYAREHQLETLQGSKSNLIGY